MAACPQCTGELPRAFGSVCPQCGFVVRVPGIVKLGLTLLVLGFVVALVWAIQADVVFAALWGLLERLVVTPLGLTPPPFELTGTMKALYDFLFGTADAPPWGGALLILGGVGVSGLGGLLLRRAESRRASPA